MAREPNAASPGLNGGSFYRGGFYKGRRVLVTGHTGLKGAWLALWLQKLGADVLGVALPPVSPLSTFSSTGDAAGMKSRIFDVCDYEAVRATFAEFRPQIVFHLAAQAIVGTGYEDPRKTFDTNVMGTVNVLEAVRRVGGVEAAVLVTSDKCYQNDDQIWGYREVDRLGGEDPYSASKAAAEIVVHAYARSFFAGGGASGDRGPSVASVRAGNVIGGGDWSPFRLVPDCIRGLRENGRVRLRSPKATRPWQFVLEPLAGYLALGQKLALGGKDFAGGWNFGPPTDEEFTVEDTARTLVRAWGSGDVEITPTQLFHEAGQLQLDCTKARRKLGWKPALTFDQGVELTAAWYRHQFDTKDGKMYEFTLRQIEQYEALLDRAWAR